MAEKLIERNTSIKAGGHTFKNHDRQTRTQTGRLQTDREIDSRRLIDRLIDRPIDKETTKTDRYADRYKIQGQQAGRKVDRL